MHPLIARERRVCRHGRQLLIEQLESGRYRVVLLDLMMPRMNGWEFRHEQLQDANLKDIPIVVVSALPLDPGAKARLGDVDYVPNAARTGVAVRAAMNNNFAFGGSNASMILTR